MEIGITERGDAALDLNWMPWVREGKPAILITKDPEKLLDVFLKDQFESHNFNIIIHTTITGFAGSILEPHIPKGPEVFEAYRNLIKFFSAERVVLRVDPVIPTEHGISLAKSVISKRDPSTRVRISFIDQYPHVHKRFKKAGIAFPWDSFHAPLDLRQKAWEELGRPEICGEPGFICTGCVSELDCRILKVKPMDSNKEQRPFCACLGNKKELLKEKKQCPHNCLYCYWRT